MEDNNSIGMAVIVCILFTILNVLESKMITKEKLEFKKLFRNIILVFLSVIGGNYILSLTKETIKTKTNVFVDSPGF